MSDIKKQIRFDPEVIKRTEDLIEQWKILESDHYNFIDIEEFRHKWLQGFVDYFYKRKNDEGKLIDPDGEVIAFWNARRANPGSSKGVNPMIGTKVMQGGEVLYLIPSTKTPLNTLQVEREGESMSALLREARNNPIAVLRSRELDLVLTTMYKKTLGDLTPAYEKHLMLDHMFQKEGYPSMLSPETAEAEIEKSSNSLGHVVVEDEDEDDDEFF